MKNSITPTLYQDLYQVRRAYIDKLHEATASYQKQLCLRDFLVFSSAYQLGQPIDILLNKSFEQFMNETPSDWKNYWQLYRKLCPDAHTPWFHGSRHPKLQPGLSKRGFERILYQQKQTFSLESWTYRSLYLAYSLREYQNSPSNFSPYYRKIYKNYLENNPNHYPFLPLGACYF